MIFRLGRRVYSYFRLLKQQGLWKGLNDRLRQQVRLAEGRAAEPSLLIGDSQTVKTTEKGGLGDMMAAS